MHDVFFFTDIHGQYALFNAMRNWCYTQDKDCTIIYGGDAADRGPDGYRIIKELLDDPRIIYLYGNHEDLFVKAADAIIGAYSCDDEHYNFLHKADQNHATFILREMSAHYNEDVRLHIHNGGEPTLLAWIEEGADEEIIDRLRNLPRTFSYENIDFCHAGGAYSAFKAVADAEYSGTTRPWYDEEMLIWDRDGVALGWATNRICAHGHTPTIYLPARAYGRDKSEATIHPCSWYDMMGAHDKRGGLKIDMDTGMTFTGRGFVLNCLTMKAIGFDDPAIRNSGVPHYATMIEEYKMM